MRALSIAASGMLAQQTNVEVISNNIANMNTTAFKRARAEFADLLYQTLVRPGGEVGGSDSRTPIGVQIGTGVRTAGIYRTTEQGNLGQTGNRFDLAIDGAGYFRIELADGSEAYTRAGSFQLNDQGELVTTDGYRVMPGFAVPADAIDVIVSATGEVQAKRAGDTAYRQLGQIDLASFQNQAGLESIGGNLMLETPASGAPVTANPGDPGMGVIRQGFLEASNVNPVAEITALISAQRAYEMNSRVIRTADEMLNATNQMR